MSFYADPSFFALLAVIVLIAAILGFCKRPLWGFGLVASIFMLFLMFMDTPEQAAALGIFLVAATISIKVLMRKPESGARFGVALVCTLTPLVSYKIGAVFDQNLLGFVGISYITFRAVQVVIETHGGLIEKMSVAELWYFLLFFPTFTSGPIDRSRRFVEDMHRRYSREEYAGMLGRGLLLILAGAIYKLVIAAIFQHYYDPQPFSGSTGVLYQIKTAYLYAGYLFFDFAGYSMMAMGAGYCLGIRVPRNFHAPFLAIDIKDFWNRWHITLSTWLRDFVFMRLVRWFMRHKVFDSRVTTASIAFLINMSLMGAWHGLTPDYLLYGLFHGVLLAVNEVYTKHSKFYKRHRNAKWYRFISWFVTMQLVIFSFALFSGQISMLVGGVL
jgi:membrane protein involved in D-alanine export